jgi:hypothetical protein
MTNSLLSKPGCLRVGFRSERDDYGWICIAWGLGQGKIQMNLCEKGFDKDIISALPGLATLRGH